VIAVLVLLWSTSRSLEAGGFLGLSYEDCVAAFGEPTQLLPSGGGGTYLFQKQGWSYAVYFHGRTVGLTIYVKADKSPLSQAAIDNIMTGYSDGLTWRSQGGGLWVRSDGKVYARQDLIDLAFFTPEMFNAMGSR
jgi:hypothetical protein